MVTTHIFKGERMVMVPAGADQELTKALKCVGGALVGVCNFADTRETSRVTGLPQDLFTKGPVAFFYTPILDRLTPVHREAIMLHEVGHIKAKHHLRLEEVEVFVDLDGQRLPVDDLQEQEADAYAASFLGGRVVAAAIIEVCRSIAQLAARETGTPYPAIWSEVEKEFARPHMAGRFKALEKL